MPKSLVRAVVRNHAPIPHNDRWNANNGQLYGSGTQDKFTQLNAMSGTGTLFAIIQLLSTGSQAMGGWKMYTKPRDGRVRYSRHDKGSDQRVEVYDHPALALWDQPNAFMTGEQFREIGWQHLELVGEWYWVLDRGPSGKGIPIAMWPVRPDRMTPVPDRQKYLLGWIYSGPNGEQVPLAASEVIQLRYPDPLDNYRGLSPVQSLLADIDSAKYTAEWSRNFFLNSATPGGIVTFDKRLSDTEFTEFTNRWREQHQGVARGHRVGVLEQGATWNPNTYTMADMQFVELRNLSREVIREAYRVHQAMLGNSTDVNRANAQTAEEVHVTWHEIPRLKRERTVLNKILLPMFKGSNTNREFDFDDPTPSSSADANDELTAKSKAAQILVAAGWHPDDVTMVVGLPRMRYVGPPAPAQTGAGNPMSTPSGQAGLPSGDVEPYDIGPNSRVTPAAIPSGPDEPGLRNELEEMPDSLVMEFAGMIMDTLEIGRTTGYELEPA